MFLSTLILASSVPLASFASRLDSVRSRQPRNATLSGRKTFTLEDMYQGNDFLNDWDFFDGDDPTHGTVNYLSKDDATSKKLAFVQDDGTTVLAVDDTTKLNVGDKRNSVRISSKKQYNSGLFIADFWAMPHGCGTWPAYWSLGPDWPNNGEIDVIEGVNQNTQNQMTLHTSSGCTTSTTARTAGQQLGNQCASSNGDNSGCGFKDSDTRSYGKDFNLQKGGVYAHLWDAGGIKVWFFSRGDVPDDITNKNPNPDSWGTPVAQWASSSCDIASHFQQHSLVINTSLCGDLGASQYPGDGCSGSCNEAVADPNNFKFAKWQINSIAVYQ